MASIEEAERFTWELRRDAAAGPDGLHRLIATAADKLDAAGDDRYRARRLGYAFETVEYHPADQAGGNFAFLIDRGGDDDFGGSLTNQSESRQGWDGGFFISH